MERSGVGEDREIDVRGDFLRQRHAQRANQREHHLPARRRRLVEPRQLAEAGVARVMVDVDREAAPQPLDVRAREVAALHDDERFGVAVDRPRDLDPVHPRKIHVVLRRRVRVHDVDLLAEACRLER